MVFQGSLSDNKSPQVLRTLLSIMANLDNAIVWMVSTRPLISKSSSPFTQALWIVPSAPITTDITVTFMLHIFLVLWQGPSTYLSFLCLLFSLRVLPGRQNPLFSRFTFFVNNH